MLEYKERARNQTAKRSRLARLTSWKMMENSSVSCKTRDRHGNRVGVWTHLLSCAGERQKVVDGNRAVIKEQNSNVNYTLTIFTLLLSVKGD